MRLELFSEEPAGTGMIIVMTRTNHSIPFGTSDEHYTPKFIFDILNVKFDLDVCAPIYGNPNLPDVKFFHKNNNGLTQNWHGNVWMNPPYSKPGEWVDKFLNHKYGIALLPITRGKWFERVWNETDKMVILPYNQKFERPDGLKSRPIMFRTALFAFGEENCKGLRNFSNYKVR